MNIDIVIQSPVKYSGPTVKEGMKEGIESGESYLLRIRKGPHSEYVTAWIYNRTNSCIAVIPYVETEWDLSGLMV